MSGKGWVRDFIDEVFTMALEIQDGFRQHVVEKGWSGEIHTGAIAPERTMAQSLGWELNVITVQPEYQPAIDIEKFFRGTATDRAHSLESEHQNQLHQDHDRER